MRRTQSKLNAWIWVIASVIYTIFPIDLIPDIPVIGWIDDSIFLLSSTLNLAEKYLNSSFYALSKLIKITKWVVIIVGIVVIIFMILFSVAIIKYLAS